MLIKALLSLVLTLLQFLFSWVSFPPVPAQVDAVFQTLIQYIGQGIGFVWLIVPRDLVLVLLPIVLILDNFDKLYTIVMWILRKIPFLGIE